MHHLLRIINRGICSHSMKKHSTVVSEYFKKTAMDDSMQDFKDAKTQKVKQRKSKPKQPQKRNTKKCKGQRDIRNVLANKKEDLISYTNEFHNVCIESGIDIDSEQLQLAIALSKSICNQEREDTDSYNPSTSTKNSSQQSQIGKIKRTLREYGFAVPETKVNFKKRRKYNDLTEYKLLKATEEEKRQIVNDKVAEIVLNFNKNVNNSISISDEHNLIQLAGKSFFYILDENCFYTDLLEKVPYTLGCQLKDWSKIPGRPESPQMRICEQDRKFTDYIDNEDDLDVLMSSSMEIVQRLLNALKNEKKENSECRSIEIERCEKAQDENVNNNIHAESLSVSCTNTSTCNDKGPTDFLITRNASPDLFDDEPSIHNSVHCVHSEIIEISDKRMEFVASTSGTAQLHGKTEILSQDFMDLTQCVSVTPLKNEEIDLTQSSNELLSPEIFDLTQDESSQCSDEIIEILQNEVSESATESNSDTFSYLPSVKLSSRVTDNLSERIPYSKNSAISDEVLSAEERDHEYSKNEEFIGVLSLGKTTGMQTENIVNSSQICHVRDKDRQADRDVSTNQSVIYEFDDANCDKSCDKNHYNERYTENMSNNESSEKTIEYQDYNNEYEFVFKENYRISEENQNNIVSCTPKGFDDDVNSKGDNFELSDQELDYSMEYFHKTLTSRNTVTPQKEEAKLKKITATPRVVTPYLNSPSITNVMTPIRSIPLRRSKSLGLDGSLPEVEITGTKLSKAEHVKRSSRVQQLKAAHSSPCSPMKRLDGTSLVTPGNTEYFYKTTNVTPLADYATFDTPKIHKELDKFGIRPIKRTKAVQLLEHIYYQTHPIMEYVDQNSPEREPKRPRVETVEKEKENDVMYEIDNFIPVLKEVPFNESDLIFQKREKSKVHGCQVPLHIAFHNYVSARSALREAILRYEPLSIDLIHKQLAKDGHKYDPKDLLRFLDQKCITVKTAEAGKTAKRSKPASRR